MAEPQYRVEHVATTPPGWHVRTVEAGRHEVRIAFPPGRRRRGAGQVVEVLHPKAEPNPCPNPGELIIFGLNPWQGQANFRTRAEAEDFKRQLEASGLRVRIVASAPGTGAENYAVVVMKKNPERPADATTETEQAVRLFEIFHGREATEVLDEQRSAAMRKDYAALGDLDYLKVEGPRGIVEINFEGDGVKLASSPDGRQLYLIGGNQDLDGSLEDFAADPQKDLLDLGEAVEVQYVARKIHSNFEPIAWYHEFGEESGARPRLLYDRLKREIFFAGGEYYVDDTREISPGIEN